jgi:hypothetical protein
MLFEGIGKLWYFEPKPLRTERDSSLRSEFKKELRSELWKKLRSEMGEEENATRHGRSGPDG